MDQQETHHSTEGQSRTPTVWETLTTAQQETVLQTIVVICGQIAEQWTAEVSHEPTAE